MTLVERLRDDPHNHHIDVLLLEAADEIERLRAAIRSTASQGIFDETAIRKAVSFELAELIIEERANQQSTNQGEKDA